MQRFWLNDYASEVLATEARRYPPLERVRMQLGSATETRSVPIPLDCLDGFNEAYYGRPEWLLEEGTRVACSAWSFVAPDTRSKYVDHLRRDLQDGRWDAQYGPLRTLPEYDGSLRLIVAN